MAPPFIEILPSPPSNLAISASPVVSTTCNTLAGVAVPIPTLLLVASTCKTFVSKEMKKKGWGRIINIGSVVGRMGNPGQSNYSASKAALEGLTRSLAAELASRNVTVNTVAPGFVTSDMTNSLSEAQQDEINGRIPLGRVGNPDEVAGCVSFLAGEDASYITGQTISVNGGLSFI